MVSQKVCFLERINISFNFHRVLFSEGILMAHRSSFGAEGPTKNLHCIRGAFLDLQSVGSYHVLNYANIDVAYFKIDGHRTFESFIFRQIPLNGLAVLKIKLDFG